MLIHSGLPWKFQVRAGPGPLNIKPEALLFCFKLKLKFQCPITRGLIKNYFESLHRLDTNFVLQSACFAKFAMQTDSGSNDVNNLLVHNEFQKLPSKLKSKCAPKNLESQFHTAIHNVNFTCFRLLKRLGWLFGCMASNVRFIQQINERSRDFRIWNPNWFEPTENNASYQVHMWTVRWISSLLFLVQNHIRN